MAQKNKKSILAAALVGSVMIIALAMVLQTPQQLLGRILDGNELLRVQAESDFDRDGDVDFLDFTVFAAFYEEE